MSRVARWIERVLCVCFGHAPRRVGQELVCRFCGTRWGYDGANQVADIDAGDEGSRWKRDGKGR